jgi:STE24 endopeptidase
MRRMPFVLLLLAFLLYVQDPWAAPWFDFSPSDAALTTLGGFCGFVLVAALLAGGIRIALRRAPYARYEILKRFTSLRRWHFLSQTAFFVLSLYILGWGWALQTWFDGNLSIFVKPLAMAPYLAALILSWALYYDVDRAAHEMLWITGDRPFLRRLAYLALNIRHNLILLVPPFILMTMQEALQLVFPQLKRREEFPLLSLGLLLSLMSISVICIPWLLRVFLGLRPLPAGDLRDQLTATARRLNFRFSDILVWNTLGTQANAMVTGLAPVLRYIVLTDRIIKELSTDEIEGVFGHEVGHVKHHHMGLYTLFLFLSLVLLGAVWAFGLDLVKAYLVPAWPDLSTLVDHQEWFLAVVIVYVFLVFGVLSRNCERQADLYGCRVATRDAFIRALEKVADINGMSRDKPGLFTAWQHWTIGQRVDFLRTLDDDPTLEARTQRRIGILKWSLTLGLMAGIIVLLSAHPWSWLRYL